MKLFLPLFAVTMFAPQEPKQSSYYPLKIGTTWEYKCENIKLVARIAKHEKFEGTLCALLETLRDGKVFSTEHIAATDDGIYRYSYENSKCDPPVRILKLPPKKGETWTVESKTSGEEFKGTFTAGEEEIEVPAGKYKTVTAESKDLEIVGSKCATTYYFAEGVGMVKQYLKLGDKEMVVELTKFTAGK